MRLLSLSTLLLSTSHLITSASIATSQHSDLTARRPISEVLAPPPEFAPLASSPLIKRKGGGGGGRSGGGGSSSSGSSGSSGSGRSSGSSSGSSSSSGRSYSPSSNAGGSTRSGSGVKPAYRGYYAGGARVPFVAGGRSPSRGFVPFLLPIGLFAFFPGIWLYGSLYAYPLGYPYYYQLNGRNQSVEVTCLCQQYSVCGCDDTGDSAYLQGLIGNGTAGPVNTTEVVVLPRLANGTQLAYVNGTLPNGTTAAGGTDPSSDAEASTMSGVGKRLVGFAGCWAMVLMVVGAVCTL
jgi:hypothetical protein